MLYSKSTKGFYDRDIHGNNVPQDVVEITYEAYVALLEGEYSGAYVIVCDPNGYPILEPVADLTTEEMAANIRSERDILLVASDWTQLRDIPTDVATSWQPYRQALRDIPSQPGFPTTVVWPVSP